MKTTVQIPELLLVRAKAIAWRDGTTLAALVEEGQRRVVRERSREYEKVFELPDASVGGRGMNPEFAGSWDAVRSAIYEGSSG